jgi:hypothetical protein
METLLSGLVADAEASAGIPLVPPAGLFGSEPERPKVDRAVLSFIKSKALHPADFTIREDGVVEAQSRVGEVFDPSL